MLKMPNYLLNLLKDDIKYFKTIDSPDLISSKYLIKHLQDKWLEV